MEVSPLIQYTVKECDLLVSAVSYGAAQRIVGKDSNVYGKCSSIVSEATTGFFCFLFFSHNDYNPLGIKSKQASKQEKYKKKLFRLYLPLRSFITGRKNVSHYAVSSTDRQQHRFAVFQLSWDFKCEGTHSSQNGIH